ncbi:MAG: hypothetical protein U5J64_00205 [Halobacteriales archaeon]|nr:hypothetical protein [Halobacteriales archaeon]
MINKAVIKLWKSMVYVPVTVIVVAGLSGWVVFETSITTDYITELVLLNPMHYLISLFLHDTTSSYITSMYFFVPAGVFLTLMTNNKNVLGVVLVSHIFAVMLSGMSFGLEVYGTPAAAFGVLAAAIVRGTKVGTEGYSAVTQKGAPIAVFFIAAIGLFMVATAGSSMSQYIPYLIGFAFGGSFEAVRVSAETRGVSNVDEEDSASRFSYMHNR